MRRALVSLMVLLAGCAESASEPETVPDEPTTPSAPYIDSMTRTLDDCPDLALVMQAPRAELQAELPPGFEAGEAIDFYLSLSPLSAVQTETGLTNGAMVVFIQACSDGFQEGYAAIYVRPPAVAASEPATGLNFVALEHGINAMWLNDLSGSLGWMLDNATTAVAHSLSQTQRSGSVAWESSDGLIASVSATGLPAHPPLTYDARVRIIQPLENGTLVYDHLAAGNMYPAATFTCTFGAETEAARLAGQTDCQNGLSRSFQAFILEGHDPTLEFSFLPA